MKDLNDARMDKLKEALLEQKRELKRHFELADETDGASLTESSGELSAYDNHPADIATETYERGRDAAIDAARAQLLLDVNRALARMEKGTYGRCETCGERIPYERLEAVPYTAYCIDHAPEADRPPARPVEEQVMTPPPKGAGENRQRAAGRFDDAGAWEAVESYGNSSDPAPSAEPESEAAATREMRE